MAQIVVRGVDDEAMRLFQLRADRRGWSKEQLARFLIEREAEAEGAWARFESRAKRLRERLRAEYGEFSDSTRDIREDRER